METKKIILKLRTERGMSQDELANKVMVTRQAVSRWENGDTVPNTDTLRLLSKEFDVSINTLLGEPRKLICQCCGMPIDDDSILGRDEDGTLNEAYCKWCYADGTYTYNDMDELVNYDRENSNNLGLGVPPKGKHVFGITKVGEKGQIVIPAKARKIFDIQPGDNLIILGDESQGIAIIKEKRLVEILSGEE